MRIKIITFWILISGFSFSVFSHGIYKLRKKVLFSSYVLVVEIDNPYNGEKTEVYDKVINDSVETTFYRVGGDGRADLYVQRSLKGEVFADSIIIRNEPSNKSPYYPDKKEALVFLGKTDSLDSYYTIGVIPVGNSAELNWYTQQVEALLRIQQIKSKRTQNIETTEWLVQCAENKYTRWDGAYELSRNRHWISNEDFFKDEKHRNHLTRSQKERLEKVFFENDTIGYTELCLSDFVSKKRNSKLKERLLLNLKIAGEKEYFSFVEALMKRYLDIEKNNQLKIIYEDFRNLTHDISIEQHEELIDRFINLGYQTKLAY